MSHANRHAAEPLEQRRLLAITINGTTGNDVISAELRFDGSVVDVTINGTASTRAVGAEMLAQPTRHLRLLDRSKLKRDPQELMQRVPELAGRERATLLSRHGPSVLPQPRAQAGQHTRLQLLGGR